MNSSKSIYIALIQIAFGLLFGLMLFPSNVKSIVIIVTSIFVLINFFSSKNTFDKNYFLSNTFYFFVLLFTLLFSNNLDVAFLKIQTMLSLIVFPLIFSLLNNEAKKRLIKFKINYFWIYIISVVVYNTIPFLWFYSGIPNYSFLGMSYHLKNFIMNNIGKYGIHPIYMSMHCCIAVIFSIKVFLFIKKKYKKILLLILNLIIFFFLLIYARKGPIIALIITLIFFSYLEYRKYFKYNLILIFGLITLFSLIPTTRNRFLELSKMSTTTVDGSSSSNIRYTIYNNSIELIKNAPFLGYGIGDYQEELNKSYQKNAPILLEKKYNSHNQYLGFLLIGGVLLLVSFLSFYGKKIILAYKTNNTLLISILIFYGVTMLFENILERENGVIFFALFINFFSLKKAK
ncbi:O-antigen ligase family protein [Polaribacter aestuariivivens]|nr:O-antigen ligase family protein [Polaribacter aestuariivivens]